MYLRRTLSENWIRADRQFPVLLLTGPRQVGKTTVLRHLCGEDRAYITLDDPTLRELAQNDPALLLQRFPPPVLIDEVQYAPDLLGHVKMLVDEDRRPGMFWLTGSQQFRMMRGVSETLAGRVAILNLLGFSSRERHEASLDVPPFLPSPDALKAREHWARPLELAELYRDIWLGSFPALATGEVVDRDLFYSSYLQTYLARDVKDLAQVGDEAAFLRFVKACAARTGQLLNLSDLARDVDVAVNTAKNWLSILQASLQVYLLEPYSTNITKRLVKTPKLYFLDTGLCAYLTEWSSPETLEAGAMSGAILETYVVCEMLKSWWHRGKTPQIYYYRDKDKREIDLLFLQDGRFYPVEVKKGATPRRQWAGSFGALGRLGHEVGPGVVLCLCRERTPLVQNVDAFPISHV